MIADARDTHGAVFERGSAVMLARVVDADGLPVTRAGVASVTYTVYEIESKTHTNTVQGHDQVVLSPAEVIYDSLQNPVVWTVDDAGYNFRHEIDVRSNEAFPDAGREYQVRYELQPAAGQKIVFRFHLRAI